MWHAGSTARRRCRSSGAATNAAPDWQLIPLLPLEVSPQLIIQLRGIPHILDRSSHEPGSRPGGWWPQSPYRHRRQLDRWSSDTPGRGVRVRIRELLGDQDAFVRIQHEVDESHGSIRMRRALGNGQVVKPNSAALRRTNVGDIRIFAVCQGRIAVVDQACPRLSRDQRGLRVVAVEQQDVGFQRRSASAWPDPAPADRWSSCRIPAPAEPCPGTSRLSSSMTSCSANCGSHRSAQLLGSNGTLVLS